MARKASTTSPVISPNSGMKRKEVGASDENMVGGNKQGVSQKLKLMSQEDHSPICVRFSNSHLGRRIKAGDRRFFFETGWASLDGWEEKIKEVWNMGLGPTSLKSTCGKLERTSLILKDWCRKGVPHIPSEIKTIQEKLDKLDDIFPTCSNQYRLLLMLRRLANNFVDCQFSFVNRKGNVAAHQLAGWMKHSAVDRIFVLMAFNKVALVIFIAMIMIIMIASVENVQAAQLSQDCQSPDPDCLTKCLAQCSLATKEICFKKCPCFCSK
ncbi:hypothetical protein RIF29_08361 [Crotalaria pallida]|uniref:Uncharacterized protein n=1 Tax=Crotalaria pallida TaxID=3830 RepID=A0AAN9IIX8_CROPI